MRRILCLPLLVVFLAPFIAAQDEDAVSPVRLTGLRAAARITRDTNGIAHIKAQNEHDLFFMQGYVHAQDRLFQIDVSRREASGTLAELVGPAALGQDVQLRTLGLRRAAQRSLPLQSSRVQAILRAYSDGINAFVASNPLPPEYQALELSHFAPWTPVDTLAVAKLIAFGLSFDLDIQPTIDFVSYQQAGHAIGFDGTKFFFEDLDRSAPFDPASTVPDGSIARASAGSRQQTLTSSSATFLHPKSLDLAREYLQKTKDIDIFRRLAKAQHGGASNEWAITGAVSASGGPLLENDPHLALGTPSTWYPIHLQAGHFDVIGNGFPGTPLVTLGHNRFISWGSTNDPIDVTDVYQEKIVPDPTSPSGFSSIYKGNLEHIIPIPEVFRVNNVGDGILNNLTTVPPGGSIPPATLIVPRRNNGPLISFDSASGIGLSVQWTGFSGTRELETFLAWNEARGLSDFRHGLSFFTSPPQNIAYSDVRGNVGYFASGEMPLREDLEAGVVNGLPPFFIRNGTGGNEWSPVIHPQPNQALPYEILPFREMPHLLNPPAGFFANSNNDPAGVTLKNDPLGQLRPSGGIYYLAYTFDAGFRAGRVTQLLRQKLANGAITFGDMQSIQADVALLDAQFFVPFITRAWDNAGTSASPQLQALATNPAIAEAVGRLRAWDFTTPTGIPQGYDAGDKNGPPFARSDREIANSIAATLYSVWRGQFVANTIDAMLSPFGLPTPPDQEALKALRHVLENFSTSGGVGASGVSFFNVPGVSSAADRRDIIILASLGNTLSLLASPTFSNAFGGSTNQADYRWGKLHRIVFAHILGAPFSIPPAGGAFSQPLANLPGIPADGGFQTVDAASHSVRAASVNGFMFDSGPSQRFVSEAQPGGMRGVSSLPGGVSGVLGSPFYINLLPQWLSDFAYDQLFRRDEIEQATLSVTKFVPATK